MKHLPPGDVSTDSDNEDPKTTPVKRTTCQTRLVTDDADKSQEIELQGTTTGAGAHKLRRSYTLWILSLLLFVAMNLHR